MRTWSYNLELRQTLTRQVFFRLHTHEVNKNPQCLRAFYHLIQRLVISFSGTACMVSYLLATTDGSTSPTRVSERRRISAPEHLEHLQYMTHYGCEPATQAGHITNLCITHIVMHATGSTALSCSRPTRREWLVCCRSHGRSFATLCLHESVFSSVQITKRVGVWPGLEAAIPVSIVTSCQHTHTDHAVTH